MARTAIKPTHSIEIKELLHFADRRMKTSKGAYIFQEGMDAAELYIILSGKIQISKITAVAENLPSGYAEKMKLLASLPYLPVTLNI